MSRPDGRPARPAAPGSRSRRTGRPANARRRPRNRRHRRLPGPGRAAHARPRGRRAVASGSARAIRRRRGNWPVRIAWLARPSQTRSSSLSALLEREPPGLRPASANGRASRVPSARPRGRRIGTTRRAGRGACRRTAPRTGTVDSALVRDRRTPGCPGFSNAWSKTSSAGEYLPLWIKFDARNRAARAKNGLAGGTLAQAARASSRRPRATRTRPGAGTLRRGWSSAPPIGRVAPAPSRAPGVHGFPCQRQLRSARSSRRTCVPADPPRPRPADPGQARSTT